MAGKVKEVAQQSDYFTADDVWAYVSTRSKVDRRFLGTVMADLAARGVIAPTSDTQKSTRKNAHGRQLRVWRSLVGY